MLLIRRRTAHADWAAPLVDSTTITTRLGLLSWVFLIHPAASDHTLGPLGHAVVAYPIGDVLLLAMVVRLVLGGGTRPAAYWLMTGSLLMFLGGDAAWSALNQVGWEPGAGAQHLLQMPYLAAYALFGAAALHPSMRAVDEKAPTHHPRLSPTPLALLTVASLIAPGILAIQVAQGDVTDGVAIVVGSVALFLLVVTRMAQLLRQVEAQAKQLRQLVLVDELTGLPNRRAWAVELPRAIERARRDGTALSIAMLDLDHFKRFNDEFGHPARDRLLRGRAPAGASAFATSTTSLAMAARSSSCSCRRPMRRRRRPRSKALERGRPPRGRNRPGSSRTSVRSANPRGRLRTCPLEPAPPSAPTTSAACCDRPRC